MFEVPGGTIVGLGVDGSPAQAVEHGIFEFATRPVDLTVSGINFGENLGESITTSGTFSAALEAASYGVPAVAASRQTDPIHYLDHTANLDFTTAAHFLSRLVEIVLAKGMPQGVDVLKLDVPESATPATPWRWTRLSRQRYYFPVKPTRRPTTTPYQWALRSAPTPPPSSPTATSAPWPSTASSRCVR